MMKHKGFLTGIFGVLLVFGLVLAGCGDDNTTTPTTPEDKPAAERWSKWVDDDATVTLEYSVDADGIATIVVDGTADSNRWKANSRYAYTAKAGKKYKYTFEAWTEAGTRSVNVQYYSDTSTETYLSLAPTPELTTTHQTFAIVGEPIPVGGECGVEFQCGDTIGTFYVKMLSIEEDGDAFTGTWETTGGGISPAMKMTIENGTFKTYLTSNDKEVQRGTYTMVSGNSGRFKLIEINTALFEGADTWKTYSQLNATEKGYLGDNDTHTATISDDDEFAIASMGNLTFTKQ